ncbi:MAG: CpaD family pilus assembly protein [Hyphomicrobiaceae bacterium]
MTNKIKSPQGLVATMKSNAIKVLSVSALALVATACRPGEDPGAHVAGWAMVEPTQRHPIIVSQQPANLTVRVARGSHGLAPQQRAHVVDFLNKYRGGDSGNGKLTINVPSGSPNEVAALHAVADLRELLRDYGLDDTRVSIKPYHTDGDPQPPIRVSYARFVAEGPQCGHWNTNLADDSTNLPFPNLGCATQRNFAAQIANPADLVGPRTMTPATSERRDVVWERFVKGESTIAKKEADERVQVKGAN